MVIEQTERHSGANVTTDPAAFAELYAAHSPRVFRYLYRLVGSAHEADDLTSDTFLQAWRAIDRYEDRGLGIERWLLTIARHIAYRHLKGRRPTVDVETAQVHIEEREQPDMAIEMLDDADEVRSAILKLPPDQRKVIVWRFLEGMAYEDIERIMGKSQGAIRVVQFRALKRLKTILTAQAA